MDTSTLKPQRDYQLDVLKLFFAFAVIINHCGVFFANENTRKPFDITWLSLGQVAVHAFFVISGLLMINSLNRKEFLSEEKGRYALTFVINKYKRIAQAYLIAVFLHLITHFIVYGADRSIKKLPLLIPEIFLFMQGGTDISMLQPHTWYLSAMLISLLPLSYIMIKNKDFYINVFAPLAALFTMGFMYSSEFSNANHLLGNKAWCGFITGGIIRAVCGLCCGAVSWLIYKKLSETIKTKKHRIFVTAAEAAVFAVIMTVWLYAGVRDEYTYVVKMLIPVLIGIVFSGKSYISEIFRHKLFRGCGSLSLVIYLTQWSSEKLIQKFMPDAGFSKSLLWMLIITAAACMVFYIIKYLIKLIWNSKLKELLT